MKTKLLLIPVFLVLALPLVGKAITLDELKAAQPAMDNMAMGQQQEGQAPSLASDKGQVLGATQMLMTPVNVGPAGSLPHWLMYHSEDAPGGMLPTSASPLKEWVPDLANIPTKTATNGNWSSIWTASTTPSTNDVVIIPAGVTVNYDLSTSGATVKTIGVKGALVFDPSKNTQLKVGTIFVYEGGTLIIKPSSTVKAEIIFSGTVNTTEDPGQYSIGLVAVGGTVDIEGSNNPTPFLHYTQAEAGQSTITFASAPSNWKAGDELILAGNIVKTISTYDGQHPGIINEERVRIQSVSGNIVTLTAPLQYTHHILKEVNITFDSGGVQHTSSIDYQRVPGVAAHITRNVLIHSENTTNIMSRGHIMVMDQTSATVKNVQLEGLGRTTNAPLNDTKRDSAGNMTSIGTNQRGRYPLHAHHVTLPFDFENNAIVQETDSGVIYNGPDESVDNLTSPANFRWALVNHNSFGTIKGNVVVWKGGSGIVTEYGTETGPITNNAVIGLGGGWYNRYCAACGADDGGRVDAAGNRLSVYDFGEGGFGFWFGSTTEEVKDNVTDGLFNMAAFDYYIDNYGRGGEQPVTRPDAVPDELPYVDKAPTDQYGGVTNFQQTPVRLFEGNTNYAHNMGSNQVPYPDSGGSFLAEWNPGYGNIYRNYTSYDGGVGPHGGGETKEMVFDNFTLYGLGSHPGTGFKRNGRNQALHILNSTITNFTTGIEGDEAGKIFLENTKVINATTPVEAVTNLAANVDATPTPGVNFIEKRGFSEVSNLSGGNQAPVVAIVNLDRGITLNTQSTVSLQAVASDPNGSITKVEFYNTDRQTFVGYGYGTQYPIYHFWNDGNKIGDGILTNGVWNFNWTNPPAGKYLISAKATDNAGASTAYGNVPIEILPSNLATPVFYRAINFGSIASSTIDGHIWEAGNFAANISGPLACTEGWAWGQPGCQQTNENYYVTPVDPAISDPVKLHMIQTGFSPTAVGTAEAPTFNPVTISNVPQGIYQVYVYNTANYGGQSFFSVVINGQLAKNNVRLAGGEWAKLGPFTATVDASGTINIQEEYATREGAPARMAGVEIYKLQSGSITNQPPHVTASVSNINRSNPLSVTADLSASVSDNNMANVTYYWKVYRAPAEPYFADKYSANTKVYLSRTGTYEVQLIATDGVFTSESNIVTIDVPPIPSVFSSAANAAVSGATFYKGYNLGGSAITISGNPWQAGNSSDLSLSSTYDASQIGSYNNQAMPLYPTVGDSNLASMLRDGTNRATVTVKNIPNGNYQVYEYIVVGNDQSVWTADMYLNGQTIQHESHCLAKILCSFGVGSWRKMGPYTIPVNNGSLVVDSYGAYGGGQYSIAGLELYSVSGIVPPPPTNAAPVVNAGVDQTIILPANAQLSGSVTDDGLPLGSTLAVAWTKTSGPGSVSFTATASPSSLASFSAAGTYTLHLSASDGSLTAGDDVVVTVSPMPDTTPPAISAIQTKTITATSSTVTWLTNELSSSWVDFGLTTSYGTTLGQTDSVTSHTVVINNLSASTLYHFRVRSADMVGNEAASGDNSFTTATNPIPNQDTPPSAITNLSLTQPTRTSFNLKWTAPGNDSSTGTAASYDIRFSTLPITDSTWSTNTQLTGEPSPKVAGTSQSYIVVGLTQGTKYYFAIKTTDTTGNTSAISNIATGTTKVKGR